MDHDERLDRPGMRLIMPGASTGGRLEIIEDGRQLGDGPPAHVHNEMDEAFYVASGAFRFERGTESIEIGAGGSVFVPHGTRHRFEATTEHARVLIYVTPPRLRAFLQAQGELIAQGIAPRETMQILEREHDVHPVD